MPDAIVIGGSETWEAEYNSVFPRLESPTTILANHHGASKPYDYICYLDNPELALEGNAYIKLCETLKNRGSAKAVSHHQDADIHTDKFMYPLSGLFAVDWALKNTKGFVHVIGMDLRGGDKRALAIWVNHLCTLPKNDVERIVAYSHEIAQAVMLSTVARRMWGQDEPLGAESVS